MRSAIFYIYNIYSLSIVMKSRRLLYYSRRLVSSACAILGKSASRRASPSFGRLTVTTSTAGSTSTCAGSRRSDLCTTTAAEFGSGQHVLR
eukprot:IDg14640t1